MINSTSHRFEFSQDETVNVSIDRYYGGLSISAKDGTTVTLVGNSTVKLEFAVLSYINGFKYQEGSQEHLDYLAKIVEAATTASRTLSEKLDEMVEA